MTIIPNQFFGLGDIIFTQTLVRRIADGRPIIWPVLPHFVEGLNRAYPDITFVDWQSMRIEYGRTDQFAFEHEELGDCTVLPLRWADTILKVPYNDCMKAKYLLYGMDFDDWRVDAKWLRDGLKELTLFKSFILHSGVEYDLINCFFGSETNKLSVDMQMSCQTISMATLSGYSLFDWQHVIQHAAAIHTVNTSIIYLLEMLELKAPEIHLYQRPIKGQTFDNIRYLLKRHKYVFHE